MAGWPADRTPGAVKLNLRHADSARKLCLKALTRYRITANTSDEKTLVTPWFLGINI
jgi:hypothetical protein